MQDQTIADRILVQEVIEKERQWSSGNMGNIISESLCV